MVLYHPNISETLKAIKSLSSQVDGICLVDNTPNPNIASAIKLIDNIHYIPLNSNMGIAKAQNIGIQFFLTHNYDFVLFSDQDSYAPSDIVFKLMEGYKTLHKHDIKIAAVVTRAINKQTGDIYSSKSKELGTPIELKNTISNNITECYSVRSSISLISIPSLSKVGGFDESLFIDGVDHEWCWRAWHTGHLRSFVIEDAKINHMLGEGDRKIGSRNISISSAFRIYYEFRNYIWLSKRDYTPKFWILKNGIKYIVKFFYFPIMVSPRIHYLKNIIKGIKDGLLKKDLKSWPNFN